MPEWLGGVGFGLLLILGYFIDQQAKRIAQLEHDVKTLKERLERHDNAIRDIVSGPPR